MDISIIGLGKLGCSMAAAIASKGFNVIGVDISRYVVDQLNAGLAPVQETKLQDLIKSNRNRLHATLSHQEAVRNSDISFVIVPTPIDKRGAFSLKYTRWAFTKLGKALTGKKGYHLVVLTSTVLPGASRYGLLPVLEHESGKRCGPDFGFCYSPEFIALGTVIHDFLNPDFTLVGEFDDKSGNMLESCYSKIMTNNPLCKRMSIENAELTKVALNTYVTTKITYANMLASLCEKIPGGDIDIVTDALGTDSRIGHKYLKGATGFGGPCFPRDNIALSFIATSLGEKAGLAETTYDINRNLVNRIIQKLTPHLKNGCTAAVLGLAYKPFSHVIEESQGLFLAKSLSKSGARVIAYDPLANEFARAELRNHAVTMDSVSDCLSQADVVLITTPDPTFKEITTNDFEDRDTPVVIVDFWRILDKKFDKSTNIHYIPVGRSIEDIKNAKCLSDLWNKT